MEFISSKDINVYSNPGVQSFQLLNPANSESERLTITRVFVEPGAEQPRHRHVDSEQIWIAVSGEGVLLLPNDEERVLREGDVVRFGDNDMHGLRNDSNRRFEYISVTSPPLDFSGAYGVK